MLDICCSDPNGACLSGDPLHLPRLISLAITPFENFLVTRMKVPRLEKLTLYPPQNPTFSSAETSPTSLDMLATALKPHLEKIETLIFSDWSDSSTSGDCVSTLGRLVSDCPSLERSKDASRASFFVVYLSDARRLRYVGVAGDNIKRIYMTIMLLALVFVAVPAPMTHQAK